MGDSHQARALKRAPDGLRGLTTVSRSNLGSPCNRRQPVARHAGSFTHSHRRVEFFAGLQHAEAKHQQLAHGGNHNLLSFETPPRLEATDQSNDRWVVTHRRQSRHVQGRPEQAEVRRIVPEAKAVVRVLAEDWGDDEHRRPRFGLRDLIRATHDLLPEATKNAFDAVQRVAMERKRSRALAAVMAAAGTAAATAATPIPLADAAAVLAVNISMIAGVSVIMGVQMSRDNSMTIAASVVGAMTVTVGRRLIAGEILKLIPGMGTVPGGMINSGIASAATYGLGYGYVEFLCRFHSAEQRMPDGNEIREGFRKFWEKWEKKDMTPPPRRLA